MNLVRDGDRWYYWGTIIHRQLHITAIARVPEPGNIQECKALARVRVIKMLVDGGLLSETIPGIRTLVLHMDQNIAGLTKLALVATNQVDMHETIRFRAADDPRPNLIHMQREAQAWGQTGKQIALGI